MRNDRRYGLSYDNRGAEPHRPWPQQRRPSPWPRRALLVVIGIAVGVACDYLAESASRCEATMGTHSRLCTD